MTSKNRDHAGHDARSVFESIRALSTGNGPVLVAIDGQGGSGKSTLARALKQLSADATIVQMDDFYRAMPETERSRLTARQGYEQYFDWQRLRDQVLTPLANGRTGNYQRYDWETETLAEWNLVEPRGLIIVEGIYSFRPELRASYEHSIFVRTSEEVRVARLLARGQNSLDWIHLWAAAEDWYIQTHQPELSVNLVVEGT